MKRKPPKGMMEMKESTMSPMMKKSTVKKPAAKGFALFKKKKK